MSSEWGPWIEHDGKGCPCVREYVQAVAERMPGDFVEVEGPCGEKGGESWNWEFWLRRDVDGNLFARIIRYRIRKPRGLIILESLLENLPEEVDA